MLLGAPSLIYVLLLAVPITALMNVTIDDEFGDSRSKLLPQYTPGDGWAQGAQCTGCSLHPGTIDVSQAVNGTWHDATYYPGQPDRAVSLSFHGVAVYVFNIVPNSAGGTTTLTNLSFFLDHAYVGQFTHAPDRTANIAYHVPVFVNRSLPDAQHSLDVRATGPNASLALFDCAVYSSTADGNNNSSTSSSSPDESETKRAGIIGGALAGSVGGVIVIVLLGLLCRRKCRKSRWDTREGDVIEQTDAGALTHVPVLSAATDELRPCPYPPPSYSNMASSPTRTGSAGLAKAGAKHHEASGTGAGADTPSQPAGNLPSVSETGRSDLSVQEDLAAIRQEIARLREQQHVTVDSLPPPYE